MTARAFLFHWKNSKHNTCGEEELLIGPGAGSFFKSRKDEHTKPSHNGGETTAFIASIFYQAEKLTRRAVRFSSHLGFKSVVHSNLHCAISLVQSRWNLGARQSQWTKPMTTRITNFLPYRNPRIIRCQSFQYRQHC
eukprot:scaffold24939_cov113-Cylindrotheca_fusiformis.AAC.1